MSEPKRHTGRPRLTEYRAISIPKIVRAYEVMGSAEGAGRLLRVPGRTIRKYLKEAGVHPKKPMGSVPFSRIAKWYKRHPDACGLRSPTRIAFIAGVPVDSAKSFLQRRRRAYGEYVGELKRRVVRATSALDADSWDWRVDPYTFRVYPFGTSLAITIEELERACEDLESEAGKAKHPGAGQDQPG